MIKCNIINLLVVTAKTTNDVTHLGSASGGKPASMCPVRVKTSFSSANLYRQNDNTVAKPMTRALRAETQTDDNK